MVCIDEIENGINAKLQKSLPGTLQTLIDSAKSRDIDIKVIISTHSPFIISAAAEFKNSQKVYLIEDGQTRDIFGVKGSGQTGYAGGDCINVVNEMLGSNIKDYFGDLAFLAEKSVCAFLAGLKENPNFGVKQFIFILSKNGEDEAKTKEMVDFRNKAFVYAGMTENLKVIIDDETQKSHEFKQFLDIHEGKVINLERDEIEPLYGEELINEFFKDTSDFNFLDSRKQHSFKEYLKSKGIINNDIKVKLGEYAGKNISREGFVKNFKTLSDLILS